MDDDPYPGAGLRPVQLADRPLLDPFFLSLRQPLSDYTFSQIYTWRNSLRILWKIIRGHLCIFANGSGDLTLLLPPIGDGQSDAALDEAVELMDSYNIAHGVPDRTRVEYASEELLNRLDRTRLQVAPMGTDYVYDVNRMIDLAGGDLKSKRQERNRFMRDNAHRAVPYNAADHLEPCLALLESWRARQDQRHEQDNDGGNIKRQKESLATELSLRCADELGLKGMVVYVTGPDGVESIRGSTFGENLGTDQSSIVIEKTDLECKGLAQFIFSEFCRTTWAHRPLVNAGDAWGLQSLAWTKMSYRPVQLLQKYVLRKQAAVAVAVNPQPVEASTPDMTQTEDDVHIRPARKDDLAAAVSLEQTCFDTYSLSKRQLQYLHGRPSAVFLVAELDGKVVGDGIGLIRHHRKGVSGRIYSLAVDPACRGRKIGQKLMQQMLDQLVARGAKRVYLEVEQANSAAMALYERLGFRSIGSLPDYYGNGRPGAHMMWEVQDQPALFDRPVVAA